MAVVEEMMETIGLEKERFRLVWCSSAEAERFVSACREMAETVRQLGPSLHRNGSHDWVSAREVAACR